MNVREVLHQLDVGLSVDTTEVLAQHLRLQTLSTGEYLMHQGEPGNSFHLVVSGTLEVVSHSAEGREIVFRGLAPGQPIGELTLIDGSPRTASIRAGGEAEVLSISRTQFLAVAMSHAELGLWLAGLCAQKTRRLAEWAEGRAFNDLDARLAALLFDLATEVPGGDPVVTVTQQALGDRLGVSRESVNKHLRRWDDAGLIQIKRGKVVIVNVDALLASTDVEPTPASDRGAL